MKRRIFLKGTLASGVIATAVGAGLLSPRQVLAEWPKKAFEADSVQSALKGLYDSDLTEPSDSVSIKAPDIAENGAVVPISVSSDLPNAESVAIFAEKNGTPLAASYQLGSTTKPSISTRIKMGETSNVIAVVKADGKAYSARKEVKVTIGGCGG